MERAQGRCRQRGECKRRASGCSSQGPQCASACSSPCQTFNMRNRTASKGVSQQHPQIPNFASSNHCGIGWVMTEHHCFV
jgi:hypothetical protein